MLPIKPSRALGLLLVACLTAACGDEDPRWAGGRTEYIGGFRGNQVSTSYNQKVRPEDTVSFWDGDGVPGQPRIEIRLSEQRAYFYKGDQLVGISQVSTGREGFNTPTGSFKVLQKDREHRSSLYGDYVDANQQVVKANVDVNKDPRPPGTTFLGSSMPYFMRVTGGVGMHTGYLPGVPASHGCIRMPDFMAQNFFYNTPMGTPVSITH
jgi:hypothetical protein